MTPGFDPYYKWLGIPPEEQPPHHYRLLGLRLFESDPEVIEAASDQRMAHLRTYQTGPYSALSQKLLNEVAAAKVCLLSVEKRARYDQTLKAAVAETAAAAQPAQAAPVPAASPPPAPAPTVPPPPANDHVFDLDRLGVSEEIGSSAVRTTSGIGRPGHGTSARREFASAEDEAGSPHLPPKLGYKGLIAVLAGSVVLLGIVTAIAVLTKGRQRGDDARPANENAPAASSPSAASAGRQSSNTAASPARSSPEADLAELRKALPELRNRGPTSPLRGTAAGRSLWLHMNFDRGTVIERDRMLFVMDLSGNNHHGICRDGRPISGRVGEALECRTPLRLLVGAVNRQPQFTVLAWVRRPQALSETWWFDETLRGDSLIAAGCEKQFIFRAWQKGRQSTSSPMRFPMLATPADQWNFIAVRSEVRNGDARASVVVNDRTIPFTNNDLLPIQVEDGGSTAAFATTAGTQIDELMVFRQALSDGDIQAVRANVNPWAAPAGMTPGSGGSAGQAAAPILAGPADGAVLPNTDPPTPILLGWQPVAGAGAYHLLVEAPNQPAPVVDRNDLQETSVPIKVMGVVAAANCRNWRWRVRALVEGQWTDWSAWRVFHLADPPDEPAQDRPPVLPTPPLPAPPERASSPPSEAKEPAIVRKPDEPKAPTVRRPLPAEKDRVRATEDAREVYQKRYAAVKTPEDRLALAYDMLQKADESDGDPAAQYVLMERARVMTLMAGDPGRAVEIAERMGRRFELDVLALKLDTLRDSIKENAAPAPRARDLGECVLQLMEQLAFAERYDAAVELGSAYRDPPGKAFNAASARRVAALVKLLRDGEPQRSGAAAASEVLKAGRNDPAAAATVGRYLCFYRGDWVTGVPRLAKGDDATLKSLAQMEQGPTSTAADRMRLGDAWFDQAEKERNRTMQFVYYRRARHWYLSCAQALSGLERSRVQARIDRIGQMGE